MKLTVLGSGTFMPQIERAGPSYLLEAGGQNFLFDFGRGAIDRLLRKKFDVYKIDKIFITHTHYDHFTELLNYFGFVLDNPYKAKFKNKFLEVYGPKGFKKTFLGVLKSLQYDKHVHIKRLKIYEFGDRETKTFGKIRVKAFYVRHSKIRKCTAYRVEFAGKVFCYSGDSSKCGELVEACKGANLALVEADISRKWKLSEVHMDGEDAGEIATEAGVKNLVLTHIASVYLKDVEKDLKKSYHGKYKVAKDLMEVNI